MEGSVYEGIHTPALLTTCEAANYHIITVIIIMNYDSSILIGSLAS